MKKYVSFGILFLIFSFLFMSCKKDDDDSSFLGAKINVELDSVLGIDKEGVTVYMYKDQEITSSTKPSDAKKQVITNSEGIAVFDLNFTELNILESQTTLYFAAFYTIGDNSHVAGSTGVTIKRNETKNVKITTVF